MMRSVSELRFLLVLLLQRGYCHPVLKIDFEVSGFGNLLFKLKSYDVVVLNETKPPSEQTVQNEITDAKEIPDPQLTTPIKIERKTDVGVASIEKETETNSGFTAVPTSVQTDEDTEQSLRPRCIFCFCPGSNCKDPRVDDDYPSRRSTRRTSRPASPRPPPSPSPEYSSDGIPVTKEDERRGAPDPRHYPRYDSRYEPRCDPRYDPRYDPRRYDPGYDPRYDRDHRYGRDYRYGRDDRYRQRNSLSWKNVAKRFKKSVMRWFCWSVVMPTIDDAAHQLCRPPPPTGPYGPYRPLEPYAPYEPYGPYESNADRRQDTVKKTEEKRDKKRKQKEKPESDSDSK